jgi:cytochrome bd-type quinol oxidase subunit 2
LNSTVGRHREHSLTADWTANMIKILIVACLLAIIVSLGSGLFHLVNDKGDSKKMVSALTVRIALSVALFILLFIAWSQGLIQPHGPGK